MRESLEKQEILARHTKCQHGYIGMVQETAYSCVDHLAVGQTWPAPRQVVHADVKTKNQEKEEAELEIQLENQDVVEAEVEEPDVINY